MFKVFRMFFSKTSFWQNRSAKPPFDIIVRNSRKSRLEQASIVRNVHIYHCAHYQSFILNSDGFHH